MRKIVGILMLAAACGGGEGGGLGSGAISVEDATPYCMADCQKDFDCGTGDPDIAACTTSCVEDFAGWARGDAVDQIFDCFADLACGANDDACASGVQPLAIHQQWEDKCRTTMAACTSPPNDPAELNSACEVSPDPLEEDLGLFRFIAPEIMTELIACLDGADCMARIECVGNALEAHGIDF